MSHHVEVGRCRTVRAGKRTGIERAADGRSRLVGDSLQETGVRDVLDEDGSNSLFAYLLDEAGDILCGRLRFGAEPLRRDESQPVVATEILERIVRGDDGPFARGKPVNDLADFRVEGLKLVHIGLAIPMVRVGIPRIGLSQSGSNVVDIGYGIAEALPGVRVESAMVMVVVACLGMLLVIVLVIMLVRCCLGLVIMVMSGFFGVDSSQP